jgi:hypothetical protein
VSETGIDAAIQIFERALEDLPDSERVRFWWRDDDATTRTPQLERLLQLSAGRKVPLSLAVIPGALDRSLIGCVSNHPQVTVLIHGWKHTNHSPDEGSNCEFPPTRPVAEMKAELTTALSTVRDAFGDQCIPVFVPPWNVFPPELEPVLAELGYAGISLGSLGMQSVTFQESGLLRADTHMEPINWNTLGLHNVAASGRGFGRRLRQGSRGPFGMLTHHLAHNPDIWDFCDRFWRMISSNERAEVVSARTIFGV